MKGKKVILRIDANVPLKKGTLTGEGAHRIESVLPTINYLVEKKARVIIITHLGRPGGVYVRSLSVAGITAYLSKRLKKKIDVIPDILNADARLQNMKAGEVVVAENIRFYADEETNNVDFAKKLAALGDVYVNDAFAVCHRAAASISAITEFLPSYAGFQLENEVKVLTRVMHHPKKPLVVVMGGVKVETKLPMIRTFAPLASAIVVGGVLGCMLKKQHIEKVHTPVDVVVKKTRGFEIQSMNECVDTDSCERILDIGPQSIKEYKKILFTAKTIIWNGPLGMFEDARFAKGTRAIAQMMIRSKACVVAGGGETVEAVMKFRMQKKITHLSTGGGALLAFLSGERLHGLVALDFYD